jgi:hypothetical protein
LDFLSGRNNWFGANSDSFVVDDFISKFDILDAHVTFVSESSDSVPIAAMNSFSPFCILITAVSCDQNFLKSQEHANWLKYQHHINHSHSHSCPQTPVTSLAFRLIFIEILKSGYQELLKKSYWIVALACLLDQIPFPVSILGEITNSEPPKTKSLFAPLSVTSQTSSDSLTASLQSPTTMIFFGNNAFVEMAGDTREEIARNPFDKYCSAPDGPPPDNPPPSIDFATPSRVAVMFYPRPPLKPFLDLQSRLPLRDPFSSE